MNEQLARQILELGPGATLDEIKKQYRKLMQLAHPDNQNFMDNAPSNIKSYDAADINAAYTYLINNYRAPKVMGSPVKQTSKARKPAYPKGSSGKRASKTNTTNKYNSYSSKDANQSEEDFLKYRQRQAEHKATAFWSAPQNPRAYTTREIYQHAEDMEGNTIGNYFVCEGKYYWTKDEDFLLFLQSIMQCGKKLLDEIDEDLNRPQRPEVYAIFQANLIYLLAQQFIDSTNTLRELSSESGKDQAGSRYKLSSMIEYTGSERASEGETLFPAGVKQHKLYIKNENNSVLGYVSFPDDRLYYVLIPLFEQKLVQVKISVLPKKQYAKASSKRVAYFKQASISSKYDNLELWVRIPNLVTNTLPENLTLQIEELLNTYRTL